MDRTAAEGRGSDISRSEVGADCCPGLLLLWELFEQLLRFTRATKAPDRDDILNLFIVNQVPLPKDALLTSEDGDDGEVPF